MAGTSTTSPVPAALDPDATLPGAGDPGASETLTATGLNAPALTDDTLLAGTNTASQARRVRGRRGPGDTFGRYVVLSKLGEGGMGVVFAAYDPELDRKVAVKLVRSGLLGDSGLSGARLVREAQALAKLSHPNIVAIYDVGVVTDEVWLAMEFVSGKTLSAWLDERPRGWREVLDVMRPAARGLAAAHDAGLVHRDFKPDNVMIGDDTRVRVMDFGLARRAQDGELAESIDDERVHALYSRSGGSNLASELTHPGAISGTPSYMSPEQFTGVDAGGSTDQFAYCVALWEALYGERPFAGDSWMEVSANIIDGRRREPARDRRVPAWVRPVVERGLAPSPSDRWPSMLDLLAALEHNRRRRYRRGAALAVVVALGVAGGVAGSEELASRRVVAACDATAAEIDEVWNPDTAEAIAAALGASNKRYARASGDRVVALLGAHAQAWRDASRAACLETKRDRVLDAPSYLRQQRCLDLSLSRASFLSEEFREPDDKTLLRAISAVRSLEPVAYCRDEARLARLPGQPQGRDAEVRSVREALARADSLLALGHVPDAMATAEEAFAAADALAWAPLLAESEWQRGRIHQKLGDLGAAESSLRAAYFGAAAAGADALALDAALALARVLADDRAEAEAGEDWYRHAEVLRARVADPDELYRSASLVSLAAIRDRQSRYDEAIELYTEARQLRQAALGAGHPEVAVITNNLAQVRGTAGDWKRESELYIEVLADLEAEYGPDHPQVAVALNNLATSQTRAGHHAEARVALTRALAVQEAALGADHIITVQLLVNLGNVQRSLGDSEAAERSYEGAIPVLEAQLGPEHPILASVFTNLGWVRIDQGRLADARSLFVRALAIREATLGPEHQALATSLSGLGEVARMQEDLDAAQGYLSRAVELFETHSGPDHPELVYPLHGLARLALDRGEPGQALLLARRASTLVSSSTDDAVQRAGVDFTLARALAGSGGSGSEVRELASGALAAYRAAGDPRFEAEITELEALLADTPSE